MSYGGMEGGQDQAVTSSGPTKATKEFLPVVRVGETYKYQEFKDALGTTVQQSQILRLTSKTRKGIIKRLRSELFPCEKLDAMRTFVMSRLDYHLRHCYP